MSRASQRLAHRPPRSSGFTLIELMVVILIIGVMATFLTLSIGHRALDERMEAESRRIEELVKLALDEADLKGVPLGLSFSTNGYRFLAIDDQRHWANYGGNELLRPRRIGDPFFAQLTVEGRPVAPAPDESPPDKTVPQILLLPGGDSSPFTLDLRAPKELVYYHLEADAQGYIRRERRADGR